jgi:hypothetical protein
MSLHGLSRMIQNPHHVALGSLVVAAIGLQWWISARRPHPLLQWPVWSLLGATALLFMADEAGAGLDVSPNNLAVISSIGIVTGGVITLRDVWRRRRDKALVEKIELEKRRYGRQPPTNLG